MITTVFEYAYPNTRIKAMKAKLLPVESFRKLVHFKTLQEIIAFLGNTDYKQDVEKLSPLYKGIELLETVLNRNLSRTLDKMVRVFPEKLKPKVFALVRKYEVYNIKTLIGGIETGSKKEEIILSLIPFGRFPSHFLKDLVEKKTVKELVFSLKGTEYFDVLFPLLEEFEKTKDLSVLESELDKFYYQKLLEEIEETFIKYIVQMEIDLKNILTVLRLKVVGAPEEKINRNIIKIEGPSSRIIRDMVKAPTLEKAINVLKSTPYKDLVSKHEHEVLYEKSLISLEKEFEKFLIKSYSKLVHVYPFSLAPSIGYLKLKEVEIRNLRIIGRFAFEKVEGVEKEVIWLE
ncbi:MAG: ATP synthase A1 subunit C [Candidatus Aenigmarchaeota archaeon]|nr:ATP synthase A1 subunit C [Candidatus Aenigmarchaeota archaeon]